MSVTARDAAPSRGTRGARPAVGAALHGLLGAVPTVVLWGLVALWTLPTAGTAVSSLRSGTAVRSTGWWTELPDPLPDRFGRALLGAVLLCVVAALVATAASAALRAGARVAAGVAAVAVGAGVAVVYPDILPALPASLGVLAVVGGVVGLGRLLRHWRGRLDGGARVAVSAAVAGAVAAVVVAVLATSLGDLTLDNYRQVFATEASDAPDMGRYFLNTVAITVPATVIPIAVAAFAAYAFAWMDFKGRHWLFVGVVAMLAVPFQMSLIPLLQLYNDGAHLTVLGETITVFPDLDLAGTTTAVWLTHIGFGLPLAIFLLHNYIAALPRDVFEAARIDGADHPTIFWRLVLPLSVPALAAFAIFQFLWVWNDYLVARTFLGAGSELAPMTIRLASLKGSRGQAWHLLTSAAFVSIAVPLLVFFSLQRYFVRGLLAGSVKG